MVYRPGGVDLYGCRRNRTARCNINCDGAQDPEGTVCSGATTITPPTKLCGIGGLTMTSDEILRSYIVHDTHVVMALDRHSNSATVKLREAVIEAALAGIVAATSIAESGRQLTPPQGY